MNILDENILASQRARLRQLGVPFRQIGYEVEHKGIQDEEIIPWLQHLRQVTFFTRDVDFYKSSLCHTHYCLVYLDVRELQAADYTRKVLRHPEFNTAAKRMGTVLRAAPTGLTMWRLHAEQESTFAWSD